MPGSTAVVRSSGQPGTIRLPRRPGQPRGHRGGGLLGLLLATTWIERGGAAGAGAVGCLAVTGTSDPWAKAALLLPLLLACPAMACCRRSARCPAPAGTATAFILSDLDVGLGLGRMMLNSYYLLPLLLAAGLRHAAPPWRLLTGAAAALRVASGLYETARLPPAPEPGPPGGLYAFLERHGLSYGYGPYWPTQANASGWVTHGRVVIRPLEAVATLPLQARRGGQVFPWWYEPGDICSTDSRVSFVGAPDVETCASVAACVAVATHSFGAPDQRLDWNGIPVLVWRRAILDHPPDAATRASAPLLLWTGGSPPGPNGAWSSGERSQVMLNLGPISPGARTLCATLHATGRPGRATQRVRVLLDGRSAGLWDVASGVARPYCVRIVPAADLAMLTLERPRLPGWRYRRDVPGIALQGLAPSGV